MAIFLKILSTFLVSLAKFLTKLGFDQLQENMRFSFFLKEYGLSKPKNSFHDLYFHTLYEFQNIISDELLLDIFCHGDVVNAFQESEDFKNNAFEETLNSVLLTDQKIRKVPKLKQYNQVPENDVIRFHDIYIQLLKRVATPIETEILFKIQSIQKELEKTKIVTYSQRQNISFYLNRIKETNALNIHLDEYINRNITQVDDLRKENQFGGLKIKKQLQLKEAVLKHNKIVLLGSAGTGKSIELQELASVYSKNESPYIVIYKSFNTYTPEKDIEQFLPDGWKNVPEESLLIIIDGFDEIEQDKFFTAVRKFNDFVCNNKTLKIIVSCRTNFYKLPINSAGTFPDFEAFFIDDLSIEDVEIHISNKFTFSAHRFINDAIENHFEELIVNPYFLKVIAEYYNETNNLSTSRAIIFDKFIMTRIKWDTEHYKDTIQINDIKQRTFLCMEKIAITMEIVGSNLINEDNLRLLVDSPDDFKNLKYCGSFKKKDGEDEIWRFEHNNVQEYIAAKALSKQKLDTIFKFISFKDLKKIVPSWLNTVTFLVSILQKGEEEMFKKLVDWIIENEPEILVRFETEKIDLNVRNKIFKQIFNYYKILEIWIDSNKYKYDDLAKFGQSDEIITFLIQEVIDLSNSRITRLNALNLLYLFDYKTYHDIGWIKDSLLKSLDNEECDYNLIHSIIYLLKKTGYNDSETIKHLYNKFKNRNNQHIRAAMYSIINSSPVFEDYIDYYIIGQKKLDKKDIIDRDDVSLFDESWNLREGIHAFKKIHSLEKIIQLIIEDDSFSHSYEFNKTYAIIIDKCTELYTSNNSIFNHVYSLLIHFISVFEQERLQKTLDFFEKTNTKLAVLNKLLVEKPDLHKFQKNRLLAFCVNNETIDLLINEYILPNNNNNDSIDIYHVLKSNNQPLSEKFLNQLKEIANIVLEIPDYPKWDDIQNKKMQEAFDILFEPDKLKLEVNRVFETLGKDEITEKELWDYRKDDKLWGQLEEFFNDSALQIIRTSRDDSKNTKKSDVIERLENPITFEFYRIENIYRNISNQERISINSSQKNIIKNWVDKTIYTVDFKKSIFENDHSTNFDPNAFYISYFIEKFNLECTQQIMLDMLSFRNHSSTYFEYFTNRISDKNLLRTRILDNLKEGIQYSTILIDHAQYAVSNKLTETYPVIIQEIKNKRHHYYDRLKLVEIYYDGTKDSNVLKQIFDELDFELKIKVCEMLLKVNEFAFIKEKLHKLYEVSTSIQAKESILKCLIQAKDIKALEWSIELIKQTKKSHFGQFKLTLSYFEEIKALPYLLELLLLSYDKSIQTDHVMDTLYSIVINGLYHLGISSQLNYGTVIKSLEVFIEKNNTIENIKFINVTIERIKNDFYRDKVEKYNFKSAIQKLAELQ